MVGSGGGGGGGGGAGYCVVSLRHRCTDSTICDVFWDEILGLLAGVGWV